MAGQVKVEDGKVKLALAQFLRGISDRTPLLKAMAASMLVSIRRTFREQGSPADSWAPLAPSTVKNPASKASAGRKILILSGRLLNSIQSQRTDTGIAIGTDLVYARVQQEGSKDYAPGPRTLAQSQASVLVGAHQTTMLREIHYTTRTTPGGHRIPTAMRTGLKVTTTVNGKVTKVRAGYQGPRQQTSHTVGEHMRLQNIPPRPYLVFRPEDPARLRQLAVEYTGRAADGAGLKLGTASGGTL